MTGFLFDENLPRVPLPHGAFSILHATNLGARLTDSEIWAFAKVNDLAIVSKDADFSQRMIISTPPPKVVHLRIGNMRRRDFTAWLPGVWRHIEFAIQSAKLVNVYRDRIEGVS